MDGARPDVLAASRWALFAERMMPQLERAEQVRGVDTKGMDSEHRLALAKAKRSANQVIPLLRELLFPEDE